jgi:hypothetical protein
LNNNKKIKAQTGAVNGFPCKGWFQTVWETSRSDKKGSLAKGAGCEQCEQTEGLKNQSISYLKSIF